MSTRRRYPTYTEEQPIGTNGRRACIECKGDIDPASRRSTFCSAKCANDFYLKSRPGHARLRVFERDRGVCSKCHIDVFASTGRRPRARGTGDLWQADHIKAVVEGGGECGLDNYRTLCTACHKSETADLAARRARARKVKKQPTVDLQEGTI